MQINKLARHLLHFIKNLFSERICNQAYRVEGPIEVLCKAVFDRFCLTGLLSLSFSPSKYSELIKSLSASYQHVNCPVFYVIFE